MLLLLITVALICSCTDSNSTKFNSKIAIDSIQKIVLDGDMILRNGTDEVSAAARSFNRKEKLYSRCGIVQIENDTTWVYHAIGGKYNPSNQLKREMLSSFCAQTENDKVAIFRYEMNAKEQINLKNIVHHYYQQKLPFDLFFNFNTDDAMYCAEFVFKSYNQALKNKLNATLIKDNEGRVYVTVDDLYLNPNRNPIFFVKR
ncbi:MAG: hypothetical protein E6Q95_05680 [Chitinophagaceae bacterium]|nr:MAG: hypothetical protein E6Q95_05680 [Chitinophagaceae bacterium]